MKRPRRGASTTAMSSLDAPLSRTASRKSSDTLGVEELPPEALVSYLEGYGYSAADGGTWRSAGTVGAEIGAAGPELEVQVTGHKETNGHTWYTIQCSMKLFGSATMSWTVARRLSHLRDGLHARIKAELGDEYAKLFTDTPFALKGGLPGTTARLNSWCRALCACINSSATPPVVVARILHFMEAPVPEDEDIDL